MLLILREPLSIFELIETYNIGLGLLRVLRRTWGKCDEVSKKG